MASTQYAKYTGLSSSAAGVTSLNTETGALTLTAGSGILITTPTSSTIQIASSLTFGNLTDVGTDGIVITGGTGSVIGSGTSISQHVADTTHNGYLSSVDWNTFNNKQNALTFGNLTDVGTDGITITGGSGAVIGSGTSISQHVADATHNGYLASVDWSTFNAKQPAGSYITALTGDVTATGPGSVPATLATVNSNIGTFASVTVNAKGLVTAAAALSGDATTSGSTLTLATVNANVGTFASATFNAKGLATAAANLSGDATTSGSVLTLATVNSNVGSFGSSTAIPSFTVNAKGLLTAASTNVVIAPAGTLTGTTLASNVVSSSLTSVGTITSGTWNGTTIAIANGGTGQSTKTAAFDALQPMTTGGDIIYGGASGTGTRLPNGSSGQFLMSNGGTAAPSWAAPTITLTAPKITRYLSSSGTHTLTGSPLYIRVKLMGGGSGGAPSGNAGTGGAGGAGGNTSWSVHGGAAIVTAGGSPGGGAVSSGGTGGGSNTFNSPSIKIVDAVGNAGTGGADNRTTSTQAGLYGGTGGAGYFGGAGTNGGSTGGNAAANTGAGGTGGGLALNAANSFAGAGGGAGGYAEFMLTTPSASYDFSVGGGGAGGSAGTNGAAGGNGGSGLVIVEEFYQ